MSMIEVRTSELSGPALDWAVAVCQEIIPPSGVTWFRLNHAYGHVGWHSGNVLRDSLGGDGFRKFSPSTDWSQGGPLIEKYKPSIQLKNIVDPSVVWAYVGLALGEGDTYLIAACRAVCSAKLGDTVQVPAELLP